MDAAEILATGIVTAGAAVVSGGVAAWLAHRFGRSERREQQETDDQRATQARIRDFRLAQLDDTVNYCLDALERIKSLTEPLSVPPTFTPPRGTDIYLLADSDLLLRFTWAVEQAEKGLLPTSRADQLQLDTLRGEVRRTWVKQRERLLRDEDPVRLTTDTADTVFDRVVVAREAVLTGQLDRTWRHRPPDAPPLSDAPPS